ncbi:MAG: M20/M25/M40 family metallo-hydrolase [Micrococcales bacterium]|nr:M20/M25/M40 family metallo-hydrolase [Micrococcales bacterium]
MESDSTDLAAQTLSICRDLIRIDTTNTGDDGSVGERLAAEYVLGLLQDLGYEPHLVESRPKRASVLLRIEGSQGSRPALVWHGHLDVVPAIAQEWQVDPFGAEVIDGILWGRGAVDMKNVDAMMLAVVKQWALTGTKPPRDILLCFFADEESGGKLGAHWLVDHQREFFEGANEAVGEVGGFSTSLAGRRTYLIQTAEKGIAWLRLVAKGTAGHGSAQNPDNAVNHLVDALSRIAQVSWPRELTPTMTALLEGASELTGLRFEPDDPAAIDQIIAAFGPAGRWVAPSLSTSCNLTGLDAGSKVNVVPGRAQAMIDIRPLPGQRDLVFETVTDLAGPQVKVETINDDVAVQAPLDRPLVSAMKAALKRADPSAGIVPYMLPAGTDAKALSRLSLACYGFAPLRLPDGFDFTAMFHGVDERVPVEALAFGAEVLADFLAQC